MVGIVIAGAAYLSAKSQSPPCYQSLKDGSPDGDVAWSCPLDGSMDGHMEPSAKQSHLRDIFSVLRIDQSESSLDLQW